jgi:hypothetical protein
MKSYIGTKQVQATPMNRGDYNAFRNWDLPADENGADEGYLVEYMDGGDPNHPDFHGYISWSPKEQFERAYRATNGLTFGLAIEALKAGKRVARSGWNGKDQFVYLIKGGQLQDVLKYGYGEYIGEPTIQSALAMKTTKNQIQVGWLASQTDMLAEDWVIVE